MQPLTSRVTRAREACQRIGRPSVPALEAAWRPAHGDDGQRAAGLVEREGARALALASAVELVIVRSPVEILDRDHELLRRVGQHFHVAERLYLRGIAENIVADGLIVVVVDDLLANARIGLELRRRRGGAADDDEADQGEEGGKPHRSVLPRVSWRWGSRRPSP